MDINTNFIAGRMNKSVDERLIPPGEYKNALNVRLGSTETTDIGAVENSKGNEKLTTLQYGGNPLSVNATCIGAYADAIRETMYWFVHDKNPNGTTVNLIVSYNSITAITTYHVVSVVVLNFNPSYLITGVQLVEELLFFTDNYNPPRVININRKYGLPSGGVDTFTEDDISLIVRPPGFSSFLNPISGAKEFDLAVPTVTLNETTNNEENFLNDRFVSFAYRYRYLDKQYSATSLFTQAAFQPKAFNIEPESMINEGMINRYNSATIEYSTGPKNVLEIQLLYKESTSNVIYIIESFVKSELGWNDNEKKEFQFSASKVYGTLGSDELLRQYDNVPQLSQALTIQGNRIMLGNYTEGYNISTINGQLIPINYSALLTSDPLTGVYLNSPFSLALTNNNPVTITYSLTPASLVPYVLYDVGPLDYSRIVFDLSTVPLPIEQGTVFDFPMQFYAVETSGTAGSSLSSGILNGGAVIGTAIDPIRLTFSYTANQEFLSAADMIDSDNFRNAVGENVNPSTAIADAPTGGTFMDVFNRTMINIADSQTINGEQYTFAFEGFSSPTNSAILSYIPTAKRFNQINGVLDCFSIAFPAVRFDGTVSGTEIFNYFRFVLEDVVTTIPTPYPPLRPIISPIFQENLRSLHSNRDYEVGLVYMDDYGRASTALVSSQNTVFIPSSSSVNTNRINVTLRNKPPFWAKKYKFVLKQSRATYNVIYVRRFYEDPSDTSIVWMALEGEDKTLVKEGTQFNVKRDDSGALNTSVIATVLAVENKERGEFITDISLPGLYMSIKPNNFNVTANITDAINFGQNPGINIRAEGSYPFCNYPVPQIFNDTSQQYELAPIPQGAIIKISFRIWRSKWDPFIGGSDPSFDWRWSQTFVSPLAYDNFLEWWVGENIEAYAGGTSNDGQAQMILPPEVENDTPTSISPFGFIDGGSSLSPSSYSGTFGLLSAGDRPTTRGGLKYLFLQRTAGSSIVPEEKEWFLQLNAYLPSGGSSIDKRPAHVDMNIEFYGQDNLLIFETLPPDADPNLFYDSSEMYNIDTDLNGDLAHEGNIQNQTIVTATPAIIQLPFFNCFSFSNGAESYQIEDSAIGKALTLGQRTTAISNIEYAKQLRQSSITYSGIYYPSSGLNNSNEFNLGLANFSDLETNFGPVMKLHSRETDILVLQEDRISYVLTGKNIISDSVGGGAIVSVPEVLGKQIARIEEYGISFNPESFTSWGKNIYFSDTKRGAIIQLTGGAVNNESLTVISDTGMRSYFRDKFITQLNTQKLGGYDPYMDEYVFSSNTKLIPVKTPVSPCGRVITPQSQSATYNVSIEVGAVVGTVNIGYNISNPNTATLDITATFNGVDTIGTALSGAGGLKVVKTTMFPTTIDITVIPSEKCTYSIDPNCITSKSDTFVTQYVLAATPNRRNPQFHFGFNWTDGIYISPASNNLARNVAPSQRDCPPSFGTISIVSDSGIASSGVIPYGGTTINMFVDSLDYPNQDNVKFDASRGHKMYAFTQRANITGCNQNLISDLSTKTPLTVVNNIDNKFEAQYTNLPISLTTYSNTNSLIAPINYIADNSVDFTTLTFYVNDIVTAASGSVGKILTIAPNLIQTGNTLTGVAETIVAPGEGYTITRLNVSQVILVYDMRDKTGAAGCRDSDTNLVCNCIGLCTPNIMTADPQASPLAACLNGSGQFPYNGSLVGRSHDGAGPIPVVGNMIYNANFTTCDPTDVPADGWYYVGDQWSNNSNIVIQISNGICIASQTQTC